ncbi:phosphate ABC transporter substrate-binding protein PstS [Chitinimonas lacunae]|uniref:Phosphate-binding protein PstS n=1 Tax=Chitinimonas lacunae TaxID=1963018 RepID=A0ABV8MMI3_9NEIS
MKSAALLTAIATALLTFNVSAANLQGAGSTFSEALYKKWSSRYQAEAGSGIDYSAIGSGEGIAQVGAKKVDFGASDEPLKRDELEQKGLRQYPVALGAVVPVVNLPGVPAGQIKLNAELLAKIYLGRIRRWSDGDIAALNDGVKLPDLPIKPIYRADASGSSFVFSYYLSALSPEWKNGPGVNRQLKINGGEAANGNEGMVAALKRTPGAIAYVDFGRVQQDRLNPVQLPNRVGIHMKPSAESIQAAAKYDAEKLIYSADPDFYLVLANNDTYNGWPLATATFALLPRSGAPKMLDFLRWAYRNGDAPMREAGYVPLSDSMKAGVRKAWARQFNYHPAP